MMKKTAVLAAVFALMGAAGFAQELKIDYQFNVAAADTANYFSFTGPIRYIAAEKDTLDAATGASAKDSTELFSAYQYDVTGKAAFSGGLRGLLLYPLSPFAQATTNAFTATKAANGVITVRYVHRGTAYELSTNPQGVLSLPGATMRRRVIGFIQGAGPQVISRDYSSAGTAATVNWAAVWNPASPTNVAIPGGPANARTSPVLADTAANDSMYFWQGDLQFTLDRNILKITGTLVPVKR